MGEHVVNPLALASPWQDEAMWKGLPLKHDLRVTLTKILSHGFQTTGVGLPAQFQNEFRSSVQTQN